MGSGTSIQVFVFSCRSFCCNCCCCVAAIIVVFVNVIDPVVFLAMVENLELRFLFLFHVLVFLVKSKKKLSDVEITGLKIFDKALIGSNETGDSFEDIYHQL